ncbi:MAG: hypothetical protein CMI69_00895, partial [Candidatus Pelagibacter sp.]|nr:hypothetical protein [Candidatus Pelagibacter sp.]
MKRFIKKIEGAAMILSKIYRSTFLVVLLSLILSACATKTTTTTTETTETTETAIKKLDAQIQADVYTGEDTVKYLAEGVPDRV